MTARSHDRVAVIVAANNARTSVHTSLARFWHEVRGRGDLILVDASSDGTAAQAQRLLRGSAHFSRPEGTLTPELWRDGLRTTDAPLVAFSTAAMIPRPGWLDAMRARLSETAAAAVGGPIAPAQALSTFDRAVYLHRYANYTRPRNNTPPPEPAGDNALYRRDSLLDLEAIIDRGFWEAAVHRALRARGERFGFAPEAVVEFQGGSRRAAMLAQRFSHARHFAADRSRSWNVMQRASARGCALVAPLLFSRIIRLQREHGERLESWLPASPDLGLLLASWSIGEAAGIAFGVAGAARGREESQTRRLQELIRS